MNEKILIGIILLGLLFLSGCVSIKSFDNLNEYCEEEGIDSCTLNNVRCYNLCKELINTTSYYFDSSGLGSSECWCYKDGEPIKAY